MTEKKDIDAKAIRVSFRNMFNKPEHCFTRNPRFKVGDKVETTFDAQPLLVLKVRPSEVSADSFDYLLKTDEGDRWYHSSAIKGKAVRQCTLGE